MSAKLVRGWNEVNDTLDAVCERLRQASDRARLLPAWGTIGQQVPDLIQRLWGVRTNKERTDAHLALIIAQLDDWLAKLDLARPHTLLAKDWPLEGLIGELEAARGLLRVAQCDIACPVQKM